MQTVVAPGQFVSHEFFMGDHINYDIPRGPLRSNYNWLDSEFEIIIIEQTAAIGKVEDDDKKDAEEILGAAQRLLSLLPKIFLVAKEDRQPTTLCHDDLSL